MRERAAALDQAAVAAPSAWAAVSVYVVVALFLVSAWMPVPTFPDYWQTRPLSLPDATRVGSIQLVIETVRGFGCGYYIAVRRRVSLLHRVLAILALLLLAFLNSYALWFGLAMAYGVDVAFRMAHATPGGPEVYVWAILFQTIAGVVLGTALRCFAQRLRPAHVPGIGA